MCNDKRYGKKVLFLFALSIAMPIVSLDTKQIGNRVKREFQKKIKPNLPKIKKQISKVKALLSRHIKDINSVKKAVFKAVKSKNFDAIDKLSPIITGMNFDTLLNFFADNIDNIDSYFKMALARAPKLAERIFKKGSSAQKEVGVEVRNFVNLISDKWNIKTVKPYLEQLERWARKLNDEAFTNQILEAVKQSLKRAESFSRNVYMKNDIATDIDNYQRKLIEKSKVIVAIDEDVIFDGAKELLKKIEGKSFNIIPILKGLSAIRKFVPTLVELMSSTIDFVIILDEKLLDADRMPKAVTNVYIFAKDGLSILQRGLNNANGILESFVKAKGKDKGTFKKQIIQEARRAGKEFKKGIMRLLNETKKKRTTVDFSQKEGTGLDEVDEVIESLPIDSVLSDDQQYNIIDEPKRKGVSRQDFEGFPEDPDEKRREKEKEEDDLKEYFANYAKEKQEHLDSIGRQESGRMSKEKEETLKNLRDYADERRQHIKERGYDKDQKSLSDVQESEQPVMTEEIEGEIGDDDLFKLEDEEILDIVATSDIEGAGETTSDKGVDLLIDERNNEKKSIPKKMPKPKFSFRITKDMPPIRFSSQELKKAKNRLRNKKGRRDKKLRGLKVIKTDNQG